MVIEIDGGIHDVADQKEYDIGRTEELTQFGIRVIRFSNEEVINNLQHVLNEIRKILTDHELKTSASPPTPKGESAHS